MEIAVQLNEFIKQHDREILKKGTDLFFTSHDEIELIQKNGEN